MKKKTVIKLFLVIFLIIILGFVFNPFYWFMEPKKIQKQPELSISEIKLFKQLEAGCSCKIERHYYNYTSKGLDTLYIDKYNKIPFNYTLSFAKSEQLSNNFNKDSIYNLGLYIKKNILNNNNMLKKIIIYKNYDTYEYNNEKDQLIEN